MTYQQIMLEIEKTEAILGYFRDLRNYPQVDSEEISDFVAAQCDQLHHKWMQLMKQRRQIIKQQYHKAEEPAV
ncbi:hypothetical protein EVU96_24750 [Bacillus infantis]|uniref:hypothetical protein n=1 Tax=Bacillus infantis TaxID=324767 RepID=UPI00101CFE26|nr:hypothetical protein [Bacillus infantis]RYI25178.1 hypothetical protein EVU96_24750 [Bacillus infantis]